LEGINWGACQAGHTLEEEEFELMDSLGVKWIRNDFAWHKLETSPGVWDFTYYDQMMDLAEQYGKKVLIVLVYDVSWLYQENDKRRNITPNRLPSYLNYVETVAKRYGTRASGFEIWNEPNTPIFWNGSMDNFWELTRQTVLSLKKIVPDTPVAVGSLFYHPLLRGKHTLKKNGAKWMS
jgi:polysaccharide biosynthesis protein PslG